MMTNYSPGYAVADFDMRKYCEWVMLDYMGTHDWDLYFISILFDIKIDETKLIGTLDETRLEDIYRMRDEYLYKNAIKSDQAHDFRASHPSALELMASLARKIEDVVMTNPEFGDRTGVWFNVMCDNLGLYPVDYFDPNYFRYIQAIIDRWLRREYDEDGAGSPFPLKYSNKNLQNETIWNCAMYYINENYKGRW